MHAITDPCNPAMDLVFVIDSSGSIEDAAPENWNRLLAFVNKIVDKRTISSSATQVGVVRYSTDVVNSFYLNTHNSKAAVMQAISNIPYEGHSTNTAGGIRDMRTVQFTAVHGDRPGVPNVAIVITDGESIVNPQNTVPEAQSAHNAGITIYSIGVTQNVERDEVRDISSPPHIQNQNYFLSENFEDGLNNILDKIFSDNCDVEKKTTTTTNTTITTTTTQAPASK